MRQHKRRHTLTYFVSIPLVAVGLVVFFVVLPKFFLPASDNNANQGLAAPVQTKGGIVLMGSATPGWATIVDLRTATLDADLFAALMKFSGIEQLKLDTKQLSLTDCEQLAAIPKLQGLSLAATNITDEHVSLLPTSLIKLSLRDTDVSDECLSHIAAMNGLMQLDFANTQVTPGGLLELKRLGTLQELSITDSCVSDETSGMLLALQLQSLEVWVTTEYGKHAHQLLHKKGTPAMRGRHHGECVLWEASTAWDYTLAGVVEVVVNECQLDAQQTDKLVEMLSPTGGMGPTVEEPFFAPVNETGPPFGIPADQVQEIDSIEQFLGMLQVSSRELRHPESAAIRRFAREKFTRQHIPMLIATMRSNSVESADLLFSVGPSLLVQHGAEMPEVVAEIQRLLSSDDARLRYRGISAFGLDGAWYTHTRDEWTSCESADALAIELLLPLYKDGTGQDAVTMNWELIEIGLRRPQYAKFILPGFVETLKRIPSWDASLARAFVHFAKVAPEATVAVVPQLRSALMELEQQLDEATEGADSELASTIRARRGAVLIALAASASPSPELAEEIALEFLDRHQRGEPIGPFPSLLSPDRSEITRRVVIEMLDLPQERAGEMKAIATTIRDWYLDQTAKE